MHSKRSSTRFLGYAIAGGLVLSVPTSSAVFAQTAPGDAADQGEPSRVYDRPTLNRLVQNRGMSLQWISWDDSRGTVKVVWEGKQLRLTGSQRQVGGPGELALDGYVTEVGVGYFTFEGEIRIANTPDQGRSCKKDKSWHFAVTQQRRYFRLREFEWCDYLTDYIDIYF